MSYKGGDFRNVGSEGMCESHHGFPFSAKFGPGTQTIISNSFSRENSFLIFKLYQFFLLNLA